MTIDIARHIGAVTREVHTRDHEGRPARVVVAGRAYDTTPDDLWDALTNIDRIPRWFLPVTGDLRLGGRFQFQGNAGGEILACDAPRRLQVTWECGGEFSWVEVRLQPLSGGRTELRLEHIAPVPDEKWAQFGPGAVGVGWEMGLLGLAEHLATGSAVAQGEGLTFLTTDDGKRMVRETSADWMRASIASGTDPAAAEAAAMRTTMAYLGETPPEAPSSAS